MKLIFERGKEGQGSALLPECDVPEFHLDVPNALKELHLPHVSENELSRHYTELAKQVHGVNDGFYPLGSCTMKYNPKVNEEAASLAGFKKSIRFSLFIQCRDVWRFSNVQKSCSVRLREWTV